MKLFNRQSEGYGNIYTPHAGSMIIQVQREHGLANRTIVLTPAQVRMLRSMASRKWLLVAALFVATWVWMVTDRAHELIARGTAPSAAAERARVDSLARQLGELQQRYDHVSRMLGGPTSSASSTGAAETAR